MIRVKNVNAFYGALHILKNISLHVGRGEIVVVLGANGSGKSTLLKTIAGIVPVREGEVILDGMPLTGGGTRQAIEEIGRASCRERV